MPSRRSRRRARPGSAPPRADAGTWRYTGLTPAVVPRAAQANALAEWANSSEINVRAIATRQSKVASELGEATMPSADWLVVRPRSAAPAAASRNYAPPPRRAVPGGQRDIGGGWVRLTPQDTSAPVYFWHSKNQASQWVHPLKPEDPRRGLLAAAAAADVQEAARCLRTGASVSTSDAYGRSALEHAAKASSAEIVSLLLRHGPPDLEARNRLGRTALHVAICHSKISIKGRGDAGCIGLLLKAGADPNATTSDGRTAHELLVASSVQGVSSSGRTEAERKAVHELLAVGVEVWYAAKAAAAGPDSEEEEEDAAVEKEAEPAPSDDIGSVGATIAPDADAAGGELAAAEETEPDAEPEGIEGPIVGQVVWGGRAEDIAADHSSLHGIALGAQSDETAALHAAATRIQAARRGEAARAMLVVQHRSVGGSALFRNRGVGVTADGERMSIAKEIAWERKSAVLIQSKFRGVLARRAARRMLKAVDGSRDAKLEKRSETGAAGQKKMGAARRLALTSQLVPNNSERFASMLSSKPVPIESQTRGAPKRSAGGNINSNGGAVLRRPRSAFAETRRQAAKGRVLRRPPRPLSAAAAADHHRSRSRARRLDEAAARSRSSATQGHGSGVAADSTWLQGMDVSGYSGAAAGAGMSLRQRPSTAGAQRSGTRARGGNTARPGSAPAGRGGAGWKSGKNLTPLSVGVPALELSIGEVHPVESSAMGTVGQVSAIPSEMLDFDSTMLTNAGGDPSSAKSRAAASTTGATSATATATAGASSPKAAATAAAGKETINPSGGVETWVSMTQESQQDYSSAIESLLSVALETDAAGGVAPHYVTNAWSKACDVALEHGTVAEIASTLGTVSIRFANIGDTWNAMDTFQRTITYDREQEKQRAAALERGSDRGSGAGGDSELDVQSADAVGNPDAPGTSGDTARAATGRFIEQPHHCDWHVAAQIYTACGDQKSARRLAEKFGSPPGSPRGSPPGSPSGSPSRALKAAPGAFNPAISEAIAAGEYHTAHELAEHSMNKRTVKAVHVRCAERRVELGEYEEAEPEFVAAGAGKRAVEMWITLRDFDRAKQCSREHERSLLPRVAAARRESNFRRHVMLGDLKRGGVACAVPYATGLRVLICSDKLSQAAVQELNAKALPKLVEHGRNLGMEMVFTSTDNSDPTRTSAVELQERLEIGEPVVFLNLASRDGDALALPRLLSTAEFRELGDILKAKEGQLVVALRRRLPHTKRGRAGSALTPPTCNASTVMELLTEVYPCDRNAVPPHHVLRSSSKVEPLGLTADVQTFLCEAIGECVSEHLPEDGAGATPMPRSRSMMAADEEEELLGLRQPRTPDRPGSATMRVSSPSPGNVSPASSNRSSSSPMGGGLIGRSARVDMAARRSLALKFNLAATALEMRGAMGVLSGRGAEHMICYTRSDSVDGSSKTLPRSAVLRDGFVRRSIPRARIREYSADDLAPPTVTVSEDDDKDPKELTEAEILERKALEITAQDAAYMNQLVADVVRDVKLVLAREHAARPGRKWAPRLAEIPRHLRQVYAAGQRGIVGRSRLLDDINASLRKPIAKGDVARPLVLEAYAPGGGRSSVVAAATHMATQQMYRWGDVPDEDAVIGPGCVVVRFLRASRYGVTCRQLLTSLIEQLNEIAALGMNEDEALANALDMILKSKDKAYGMTTQRPPSPQSPGSDQGSPSVNARQMERHLARLNEQERMVRGLQDKRRRELMAREKELLKQRSQAEAAISITEEKLAHAEAEVEHWERKVARLVAEEEDAIVLSSGLAASGAVEPLIEAMDARALHIANRPEREWQPIGRVAAEARLDDLKLDTMKLRDELHAKRDALHEISSTSDTTKVCTSFAAICPSTVCLLPPSR